MKPVFGVSDQVILKPACSATETTCNIAISRVTSLDMTLSSKVNNKTKMLIRLHSCAGWSVPLLFANPEDRFSRTKAQIALDTC